MTGCTYALICQRYGIGIGQDLKAQAENLITVFSSRGLTSTKSPMDFNT